MSGKKFEFWSKDGTPRPIWIGPNGEKLDILPCAWCGENPEVCSILDPPIGYYCGNMECPFGYLSDGDHYAVASQLTSWNIRQREITAGRRRDFDAGRQAQRGIANNILYLDGVPVEMDGGVFEEYLKRSRPK